MPKIWPKNEDKPVYISLSVKPILEVHSKYYLTKEKKNSNSGTTTTQSITNCNISNNIFPQIFGMCNHLFTFCKKGKARDKINIGKYTTTTIRVQQEETPAGEFKELIVLTL